MKRKLYYTVDSCMFSVFFLSMAVLGANALSMASAANDVRTVKDFGAKADAIADDTTAIQAAVDATGIAYLPPGNYRITNQIKLLDRGGLMGPGTIIVDFDKGKPYTENAAILVAGDDVGIEGVRIQKQFIDGSYDSGIVVRSGHRNITIRNVEISGYSARYGVHIIEAEDFEVTGCFIHDFMMNAEADMIEDSPAGIRITRSKRGVVSNNRLLKIEVGPTGRASISPLKPGYGPQGYQSDHITLHECSGVSLTGNVLETSGEGIDLLLSKDCAITGNVIRDIWFMGVKMLGVSYCTVTGNHISEAHRSIGLSGHGSSACTGNAVVGNTILDPSSAGSFGAAAVQRPGPPCGIEIERCEGNLITSNVILDTQNKATKGLLIHQNAKFGNIYDKNLTQISADHDRKVKDF